MFWSTMLVDSAMETDEFSMSHNRGQASCLRAESRLGSPSLMGLAVSRHSVSAPC